MEYEIAEEGELLDRSNNPSLDCREHIRPSPLIVAIPALRRSSSLQKAELIPEEAERA